MILEPTVVMALALRCAPSAAPETLLAVVRAESRLNPFAIGVNGDGAPVVPPRSAAEATATARRLLARGANLDLGLAQINSANLGRLGLTVADAFDPCRSLAAAATVLGEDYTRAHGAEPEEQAALRQAFSLYNTGDAARGFRNGYVARVEAAASSADAGSPRQAPAPPPWAVFVATQTTAGFVISPIPTSEGADR